MGPGLVGQFWGLDSNRVLEPVLREVVLFQEMQMPQAAADPWAIACSIPPVYAAAAPASVPPSDADLKASPTHRFS